MAGRPIDAVIFDMDGLMIDSEPLWHVAEMEAFAAAGITLREDDCNDTTGLRIDEVVAYHAERKPWGDTPTRAEVAQQASSCMLTSWLALRPDSPLPLPPSSDHSRPPWRLTAAGSCCAAAPARCRS